MTMFVFSILPRSSVTNRQHFDSQDINVLEGKEFRDLVLYGRDNVTNVISPTGQSSLSSSSKPMKRSTETYLTISRCVKLVT